MTMRILMITGAAMFLAALTTFASTPENITYLTFSRSVAIPGATLAPGTYVFEEVDTAHDANVVRVLSRDRSHVYLTQFAREVERPAGSSADRAVVLGEISGNAAPPVLAWFRPGSRTGYAFVY